MPSIGNDDIILNAWIDHLMGFGNTQTTYHQIVANKNWTIQTLIDKLYDHRLISNHNKAVLQLPQNQVLVNSSTLEQEGLQMGSHIRIIDSIHVGSQRLPLANTDLDSFNPISSVDLTQQPANQQPRFGANPFPLPYRRPSTPRFRMIRH